MADLPDNVSIQKLEGSRDLADVREIRRKVFVEEQKINDGLEWDGLDSFYQHFLFKHSGLYVGTARAKINAMHEGKIGRLCLLPEVRGKKLGRLLLDYIIADMKKNDKNLKVIKVSSQTAAVPFYEKAGFVKSGEEYTDATGVPHYAMTWTP